MAKRLDRVLGRNVLGRLALTTVAAAALTMADLGGPASAQGTLRLGMTAADIPLTVGQPDNGFEGYRWIGLTLYDGLINWDLSSADKASGLIPGLAESWSVDPNDPTKWVFKLRQGVKFHDGSPFNAEAVIWNMDRLFDDKAAHYDPRQVSLVNFRIPAYKSIRKIDDHTIEITTKSPDAFFPYQICYILHSSPAQWNKFKDWQKFATEPSGTGPWKLTTLVPRERAELVPNKDYWDPARRPKLDKLILLPIPEPSARTAAALSGQVDWIEGPAPDAVPRLKQQGFNIVANAYPHIWSYHISRLGDSPWNDLRVRKAANLAIDRKGLVELLGGYAAPALGHVDKADPWFGKPSFELKFDPDQAKKLLAEAGYGPAKPLKIKGMISASGSGQMQPLAMNEYIQQNLKDVGIQVEFAVVEWQSLLDRWRAGSASPQSQGAHFVNISYTTQDPYSAFTRLLRSDLKAPTGVNWGEFSDPAMDELLKKAQLSFDAKSQTAALADIHTKMVDEALFIWAVHDVAPRAIHKKVKGFVQARNWFQDITGVYIQN